MGRRPSIAAISAMVCAPTDIITEHQDIFVERVVEIVEHRCADGV
jgi:hypothetical protein